MNLTDFIDQLQARRQLLEIDSEVDGRLELAALTDLQSKKGGPGLLFRRVRGSCLTLASNLFGNEQRMAAALGCASITDFGNGLTTALCAAAGESSAERLGNLAAPAAVTLRSPARLNSEVDLGFLPQLRYWPLEERSFLTLAVVITKNPLSGVQNYGLYRIGVAGARRLTLNLLPGSGAGEHLELWHRQGKTMPVAVLLGADPALIFAAAAPLPAFCSEEKFSAFASRSAFDSQRCETVPLDCPVSGQILIEGQVDPLQLVNEGPFGCYTGGYGGSNDCPLIEISAISRVAKPILPLTVAGPLPMEDGWIARANLELIRVRLRIDCPLVSSLEMPLDAAFHGLYFVRSSDPRLTVVDLMQQLRGLDYLRRLKMLVLLREQDARITEANWRAQLADLPAEQKWKDAEVDFEPLLHDPPVELQHDAQMIKALVARLRSTGHAL